MWVFGSTFNEHSHVFISKSPIAGIADFIATQLFARDNKDWIRAGNVRSREYRRDQTCHDADNFQ